MCCWSIRRYMRCAPCICRNPPGSRRPWSGTVTAGVLIPVVGHFVDRFGPRCFLRLAPVLLIILAWPMFSFINASPSLTSLLIYQLVFGVVIALYQGPILSGIGDMFPEPRAGDGTWAVGQHRGLGVRRHGRADDHLADRADRQQPGAGVLPDGGRRGRPARHIAAAQVGSANAQGCCAVFEHLATA